MNQLKTIAFATLLAVGSTWAVAQESASDAATQNDSQSTQRDNDTNWGWIGLLGLAGLVGLKRKDPEPAIRAANRAS